MPRILLLSALLSSLWIAAACRGGQHRAEPTTAGPETFVPAASAELAPALLTLGDVPPAWVTGHSGTTEGRGSNVICGAPLPPEDVLAEADATFAQPSSNGRLLVEHVVRYRAGQAADLLAGAALRVSTCHGWTETDDNGTVEYRLSVLKGDWPFEVRIAFDRPPEWSEDVVAIRRDDLVAWVSYGGSNLDDNERDAMLRSAAARLGNVAPGSDNP